MVDCAAERRKCSAERADAGSAAAMPAKANERMRKEDGGTEEATFEAAIVAIIKADGGKVAMSKLANSVKKPVGLKKFGTFFKANPKVFKVVGNDVTLA